MSILTMALPIVTAINGLLNDKKADVAAKTGLSVETVGKVSGVVGDLLTKDERVVEAIMAEVDKARTHDAGMVASNILPLVSLLRGLVRPVITLTAFFWYVYARCAGLPMNGEDYAIVGGIMAFWFGLRPFEKGDDNKNVAVSQPMRGK
ncbi:MAG: hypothetical protein DI585_05520 [Pseudomonas fluorescens]|nr:MAG: hypothetical protein DI585_05520 [Pseudomonas fluorescens]